MPEHKCKIGATPVYAGMRAQRGLYKDIALKKRGADKHRSIPNQSIIGKPIQPHRIQYTNERASVEVAKRVVSRWYLGHYGRRVRGIGIAVQTPGSVGRHRFEEFERLLWTFPRR